MATPTKTGRERQEESSNAGGKPGLRKPVFTKVDQLKPGTGGQTLTVEVLNSIDVLPKGLWVSHHLRQSRIADTGSIIFTPRNDQGHSMKRNDVYKVWMGNCSQVNFSGLEAFSST
ncbi:hypothetical protein DKX38_025724 [Salix brachista]|uniref:Single-stranded DNA binding protein Ssb-like OB fold domain-containing protein n=1 Tax=Salix brachista TaxID=2182728 RepID=A0A5N5JVR8_9ROSI|nr:hypothetical protein DKX38_025724 [Salix brachista]